MPLHHLPLAFLVTLISFSPARTPTPPPPPTHAAPPAAREPAPRFAWPLPPPRTIARPFEPPSSPYGPGHRGVDLRGVVGEPVRAAGAGVVAFAGVVAGRAVVSVDHGALRTTYEPVTPSVVLGARVARGDPIGALAGGHAGCGGACLHWGLRRGAEYLDPVLLVRAPRVRLLPAQTSAVSRSLARRRRTARVCSWQTRDSVTPRTRPISARVRFSK